MILSRITSLLTPIRRRRRSASASVSLEQRTLLATLVGNNRVTYRDTDGDNVTVTLSKPILNAANVNAIFQFNNGSVNGNNGDFQQLMSINLTNVPGAAGTGITTVATRSPVVRGDGRAAIGEILAFNEDLGTFVLDGDLGRIVAGDANLNTTGVVSLTAHSIGRFSTYTGAVDLSSDVLGRFGTLKTKTDIAHARIKATSFGTISIGGSLIGGNDLNTGAIEALTTLGTVTVAGDLIGGAGERSGYFKGASAASVTVSGDVIGGAGLYSGSTEVSGAISNITVGGSVIGGAGKSSGQIGVNSVTGTLKVGESMIGGAGETSGAVISSNISTVSIGGNLQGGQGSGSGTLYIHQRLGTITVNGSIIGGSASGAADLEASGTVYAGQIGTMTLGGSLIAGTDNTFGAFKDNGSIISETNITSLTIKRSIIGNATSPVVIRAYGQPLESGTTDIAIGTLKVTGRVERGQILAGVASFFAVNADAQIGTVTVGGDWIQSDLVAGISHGGDGKFGTFDDVVWSGVFTRDRPSVASRINSVTIGGQVIGSSNFGIESWAITAQQIGTVKVGDTTFPFSSSVAGELHTLGLHFNLSAIEIL